MSHSAHALNAVERAELARLEALIEAGASQDVPAGEVERIYYVRGVLRDTWQFLLVSGTELASAIRTWLPVDGMAYVISPAVAAPMMRSVSDTACMFDTVALPPCLLLANPQLAGELAGDGGPLERIARRVLADQVGAREIANCLATWPELRVSLDAVVGTYMAVAAHYGWDAEREAQQPQPLAAAALAAFDQALAVLATAVERFRGPASPPDTASPPDPAKADHGPGEKQDPTKPSQVKGKHINGRMLAGIQEDSERMYWSSAQWAENLGCAESTVKETPTWRQTCMPARERARLAEGKRLRRKKPR